MSTPSRRTSAQGATTRRRVRQNDLQTLALPNLAGEPWLLYGFSTRGGGVTSEYGGGALNLGKTQEDSVANVQCNLRLFFASLGIGPEKARAGSDGANGWSLVTVRQIHSSIIHEVGGPEHPTSAILPPRQTKSRLAGTSVLAAENPLAGDGLVTRVPGVLLGIKVADCLPVLVADPDKRAVGAFHAGWRGTAQRIVEKGIGEMRQRFGSDPRRLRVGIGAGIGVCCYRIGDEVEHEFESQFAYSAELFEDVFDYESLHIRYPMLFLNQRAPGHGEPAMVRHLNLLKANLRQLREAGVPEENVASLGFCTSCRNDLFFSYRKERVTGRLMAVIGIRP